MSASQGSRIWQDGNRSAKAHHFIYYGIKEYECNVVTYIKTAMFFHRTKARRRNIAEKRYKKYNTTFPFPQCLLKSNEYEPGIPHWRNGNRSANAHHFIYYGIKEYECNIVMYINTADSFIAQKQDEETLRKRDTKSITLND